MKLSAILSLGLFALSATQTPTEAQTTCGPRIRRNWDALSDSDKSTYKGAIASAMDSGAYIKFVEIHHEAMSNAEAHGQCMFIYWHRYFLVAFENMLRAQGDEFACVTLPYFNWMDAHSQMLDGKCTSLGDCAKITGELGGSSGGSTQTVEITGDQVDGTCVNEWPLDHFCQSSTPGRDCSGCVPRGDWESTKLPGAAAFSSVGEQFFSPSNIDGFSNRLEDGAHASVHATLGGAMNHQSSPADPIFYSHHSMVDGLHTIYHKCRVGAQRMTFEEKASDPVAWSSCDRKNGGGPFNPTDVVTVNTGPNSNPLNATQDSVVSRFFEGVPNRFADLMDSRDLGDFSYSYEFGGQLASMYNNCDGTTVVEPTTAPVTTTRTPTPTTRAPAPASTTGAPEPTTTNAPEPTTDAPAPTMSSPEVTTTPSTPIMISGVPSPANMQMEDVHHFFDNLWNKLFPANTRSFRKLVADEEMEDATAIKQQVDTATPTPSKGKDDHDQVDVVIVDECGESEQRVLDWYQQTATAMGGMSADTRADLERQSCMFHDQCLGGVTDFSDEFKATWGLKEARCKTIVDAVKCGAQPIIYTQWRETMEAHFGCPMPTTAAPTIQDQTSQTDQTIQTDQVQQQQTDGNVVDSITGVISQFTQSA